MFATIFWFSFFSIASANVSINEIAWMGTAVSGTDEWIELVNDSDTSVDLSGWRIEAEDGSPSIGLSGMIAANGYFLIERTDDTTVPDITADLVAPFGNGLSNTGETLRLKDAGGVIIDVVAGGVDWGNIGGDNATKETAQKTSGSWVTGSPTPRVQNVSSGTVLGANTSDTTEDTASSNETIVATSATTESSYAKSLYPRESMSVFAGSDKRTFTGLSVEFHGNALGLYDETLPYANYRWNFGDGATGIGATVSHTYKFAGEYVVTLHVRNASLEQTDRLTVSVSEPSIVMTRFVSGTDGFVELKNQSNREVDISGWIVSSSDDMHAFMFPEHTLLEGKHATIFPNTVTGLYSTDRVVLSYPSGVRVGETTPPSLTPAVIVEQPRVSQAASLSVSSPRSATHISTASTQTLKDTQSPSFASKDERLVMDNAIATNSVAAATILWERDAKKQGEPLGFLDSGGLQWFFILLGMALLVLAGIVIARSRVDEPSLADEYAIVSDIIDDGEEPMESVTRR